MWWDQLSSSPLNIPECSNLSFLNDDVILLILQV
jgi:hypothetical protein